MRATVRVRVLATDGPQVWIAVSGRLARSTLPALAQALRERAGEGFTAFFLDISTLADDRDVPADALRELFPGGARLTFHLIGAAGVLRLQPGHDRRLVFHPDPSSAWTVWVCGPPPRGARGRRAARTPAVRTRSRRSSLGSVT